MAEMGGSLTGQPEPRTGTGIAPFGVFAVFAGPILTARRKKRFFFLECSANPASLALRFCLGLFLSRVSFCFDLLGCIALASCYFLV